MKQTHQSFSISFVCGPPGSGKSYLLTRDVIERLCTFGGKVYTNLPLNVEKVAGYVADKLGQDVAEVRCRIVLFSRETLVAWQDGRSGPWELIGQGAADGNDFILDECHLFCKKGQSKRNQEWERWLGEARHEGWRRIVFVTQDESKVGQPITAHAELRFELTNAERLRDPLLRIPLAYWYELVASFTREYSASIAVTEYRRVKGRLREQHIERLRLDPYWFSFYRSYEVAGGGAGTGEGGSRIVREFERRPVFLPKRIDGRLTAPVWLWLVKSHWWRFALAASASSVLGWVCFGGGGTVLLEQFVKRLQGAAPANRQVATTENAPLNKSSEPAAENEPAPTQVLPSPASENVTDGALRGGRPRPREVAAALMRISDGETRRLLTAELRSLSEQFQQQEVRIAQLQKEAELRARSARLVAVEKDRVWFDGGAEYQVGEVIYEGPLAGKKLAEIDFERRAARLDDGSVVRLGASFVGLPDVRAGRAGATGRPGIREPVPVLGAEGSDEQLEPVDAPRDAERGGDGLRSLLSPPGRPGGNLDRRRERPGESVDHDGSQGPAGG